MTISKEEWESLIRRVEKLEGKTSFSLEEMKEAMREALAGKGKGARMTGEYVTKREDGLKSEYIVYSTCLSDVVEISFQVPTSDWLKLEKSEVWKNLDKYLSEVQRPYTKMRHRDQLIVPGAVAYKNPLSKFVRYVCGR